MGAHVKQPLSQRQIKELQKSPHVRLANENMLSFTAEFKEYAYNERQRGVPIREILINSGIDPDLMGKRRIHNFLVSLREQGGRGTGFSDILKKAALPIDKRAAKTIDDKVARLQSEFSHVKQDLEHLKKMFLEDREAQQKSKPKCSSHTDSKSSET